MDQNQVEFDRLMKLCSILLPEYLVQKISPFHFTISNLKTKISWKIGYFPDDKFISVTKQAFKYSLNASNFLNKMKLHEEQQEMSQEDFVNFIQTMK